MPNSCRRGRHLVDIELVELDVCVLVRQIDDFGRNGFAGAAPGGETVDYEDAGAERAVLKEASLGGS